MSKIFRVAFLLLFSVFCFGLAQGLEAQNKTPEIRRESDQGKNDDKGAKPFRLVLPKKQGSPSKKVNTPPVTTGFPPVQKKSPEPPREQEPRDPPVVAEGDAPPFFGEPVVGNFVFVLDRSGSMSSTLSTPIEDWNGNVVSRPSFLRTVKAEAIRVISGLTEDNEFAVVTFGGGPEWTWYDSRIKATEGNKQAAINEIQKMRASGSTPAYTALKKACTLYGTDLHKIFFLCDGGPNSDSGAPGGYGGASKILSHFPQWYEHLRANGCELVCIQIGGSSAAKKFMKDLANQNSGKYIQKK